MLRHQCECSDAGCAEHKGKSVCYAMRTQYLYRVDMRDETGTAFCEACASDAMDSGVFSSKPDDGSEDDEPDSVLFCNTEPSLSSLPERAP